MSRIIRLLAASLFACSATAQFAVAAPIVLPPPVSPFAAQHDDFFSYSAKILTEYGLSGFNVPAGTAGLDLVVYTGANGANNTTMGAGNAFTFPGPLNAPGGNASTFSGVYGAIPVDYLLGYLQATFGPTVNTPVFNFDMNEPGSQPDLQVVGDVIIRNAASAIVTDFSFDAINNGVFDPTAWVTAPGEITVPDPNNPGQFITVNNHGGGLDFVVYSPSLNLANFAGLGYTIEFDIRMQGLGGGFEKEFLTGSFQPGPEQFVAHTPEPGTMLLMGVGALAAAFMRRRKRIA